jgi:hypothetical protein
MYIFYFNFILIFYINLMLKKINNHVEISLLLYNSQQMGIKTDVAQKSH